MLGDDKKKIGKIVPNASRSIDSYREHCFNEYLVWFDEEGDVNYNKNLAKVDLADGDETQENVEDWYYDEDYDGEEDWD